MRSGGYEDNRGVGGDALLWKERNKGDWENSTVC